MKELCFRSGHSSIILVAHGRGKVGDGPGTMLSSADAVSVLRRISDDPKVQRGVRELCAASSSGGATTSLEEEITALGRLIDAGVVRVYKTASSVISTAYSAYSTSKIARDNTPVPFLDDKGTQIFDYKGGKMMRPKEPPPGYFVSQGSKDKASDYSGKILLWDRLSQFAQGGTWDMQRVDGVVIKAFIDYATVVIGLYAAAYGADEDYVLRIENRFAMLNSNFGSVQMSAKYSHLPNRNVFNTDLGYSLYIQGSISPLTP